MCWYLYNILLLLYVITLHVRWRALYARGGDSFARLRLHYSMYTHRVLERIVYNIISITITIVIVFDVMSIRHTRKRQATAVLIIISFVWTAESRY